MESEDRSVFDLPNATPTKTFSYGKSADQLIDFYLPSKSDKPVIVLIHGGYWRPEYDRLHLSPLAKKLSESGWPVALIEYRRIIGNPDAMISDVIESVRNISLQFPEYILLGHSAGGHLALSIANQSSPIGIIALAPVTDLIEAEIKNFDDGAVADFLGVPAELRNDLNPINLQAPSVTTVILHGTKDFRVPIESSRNYHSHMNSSNIEFTEFEDLGHFELIDPKHGFYSVLIEKLAFLNDRFHQ
ncbi:MAG: alpha/beta hydrolase [Actinomycetes bacterium]